MGREEAILLGRVVVRMSTNLVVFGERGLLASSSCAALILLTNERTYAYYSCVICII